jgi:hypothetical protein
MSSTAAMIVPPVLPADVAPRGDELACTGAIDATKDRLAIDTASWAAA